MKSEKAADLTTAAMVAARNYLIFLKILEELFDSYEQREVAIPEQTQKMATDVIAKAEQAEEKATDILLKSQKIIGNTECDGLNDKIIRQKMDEDKKDWEEEKESITRTHSTCSEFKQPIDVLSTQNMARITQDAQGMWYMPFNIAKDVFL
jgi:hypothetical protein